MTAAHQPEEINIRWGEARQAGDLSALLDLYEPDAVLVPSPGAEPISGLDAMKPNLQWLIDLGGTMTAERNYWIRHGDLALGSIDFHLVDGTDGDGNPIELRGTTVEVVRRQPDGTWKYVIDHPFGGGE